MVIWLELIQVEQVWLLAAPPTIDNCELSNLAIVDLLNESLFDTDFIFFQFTKQKIFLIKINI